jgi:hypothetical protein
LNVLRVLCASAALFLAAPTLHAQEVDDAHIRREIDRDPARAVDELNGLIKSASESTRPKLLLLRAQALAKLGEKKFALEDAKAILEGPGAEELETETATLVRSLEGLEVELHAPRGLLVPGPTSVAIVGSGRGALPVEWAVYRIDERKLREALSARPDLEALLARPPALALSRVDAGHARIEARGAFEQSVPVEATRAPGIYLVAANVGLVPVRATLRVARHALAARATASGLLAWTFDRATGEPRDGAALDLLGDRLERLGATDTAGLLEMRPASRGRLLAWSEGALATLSLDGVAFPASAAAPLDLLVTRPLLHPGETARALAVSPVVSSTHRVLLVDPAGQTLLEREVSLDANGAGSLEVVLPRVARSGVWKLATPGGDASFRVEPWPKTPAFSVEIPELAARGRGARFVAGDALLCHVRALGCAGAAASWTLRPRGSGAVIARGAGPLDEDGELKVAFRPLPPGDLVLEALVHDVAGRDGQESVLLHVDPSRLAIELGAEPPLAARTGETFDFHLAIVDLEGKRAHDVSLVASASVDGRKIAWLEARLDSNVATLHVPLDADGLVQVGVLARSPLGEARLERTIAVVREALPAGAALLVDRDEHRPGERARLFARMPRERGWALVTKERGGIRARAVERFERGMLAAEIPLEASDEPGVDLVVACVDSGVLVAQRRHVTISRASKLEAALEVRGPEPLELEVRASEAGAPVVAGLEVLASDARAFELLTGTASAHGFARPAPGAFFSQLVEVDERGVSVAQASRPRALGGRDAVGGGADDDPALLARARSLALAPDFLSVATTDSAAVVSVPIAGDLRVEAVVARDGRFARASRDALVEPGLAVFVDVPPRLVEGDEGEVEATVVNALDQPREVKVTWVPRGLILRGSPRLMEAKPAPGHELEADALWVAIPAHGRARLAFLVKAPAPGRAELEVAALAETLRAQATGTALVHGRSAAREATLSGVVLPGHDVKLELLPWLDDASRPEAVAAELVLQPGVAHAASDALRVVRSSDELDPETLAARLAPDVAALGSLSGIEIAAVDTDALLSLLELQRPDGSWPSSATASALEAVSAVSSAGLSGPSTETGFLLGPSIERGVRAAHRELAMSTLPEKPALLVALARARGVSKDELDAVFARRAELDALGRFTLGRALVLAGDPERARALIGGSPGTTTEAVAAELLLLSELGEDPARRLAIARGPLVEQRSGLVWSSPRETALAARSLLEVAVVSSLRPVRVTSDWLKDGRHAPVPRKLDGRLVQEVRSVTLGAAGGDFGLYAFTVRWTKLTQGLKPLDRGLTLKRSCSRFVQNEDGTTALEPVTVRGVPRGSELRVTLALETHAIDPIVVEEPLPAGVRFLGEVGSSGAVVEAREARLVIRFPGTGSLTRSFTYALRAERPGDWRALVAQGRLVGRTEIAGESEEWLLRVKD